MKSGKYILLIGVLVAALMLNALAFANHKITSGNDISTTGASGRCTVSYSAWTRSNVSVHTISVSAYIYVDNRFVTALEQDRNNTNYVSVLGSRSNEVRGWWKNSSTHIAYDGTHTVGDANTNQEYCSGGIT